MKAWIERALNVCPGDLGRGLLLCASLFLVITSTVIGKVAGAALFLSHSKATDLALIDMVSAALVVIVVAAYGLIARWASVTTLVAGSMVVFASNCVLFWSLSRAHTRSAWLYAVFYAWVRIVAVLAPAQIWTLANVVFTTREAKRVFGVVGGGAILGWICAGFLCNQVAKRVGTETLILCMAILLALCSGLAVIARRYCHAGLSSEEEADRSLSSGHSGSTLRLILTSPYLRSIATVICISSFITTLTGWQFMAIAQQHLVSKDAMTVYFGAFSFYTGLLSLLFQVFLTTRFVRRFGIGTSLGLLPITILLGSFGLLIFGTLAAAVALRGCDQVIRYSIDRSTTELLYLPIASRIKVRVKWFIDTLIWRLGDGLAGLAVIVFASAFALPARDLSAVAISAAGLWMLAIAAARREYVIALKQNISQQTIDVTEISPLVLDRSTADLLADNIHHSDPKQILYALDLLQSDRRAVHPAVRMLLDHSVPEIRSKAILILSNAGDCSVISEMKNLLHDPDLDVRTNALLYLAHNERVDPLHLISDTSEFAHFSITSAIASFLARPGESQNVEVARQILEGLLKEDGARDVRCRVEVAQVLGALPDRFDPMLPALLADPDPFVVEEAIRSIEKLQKRELAPDVIQKLAPPQLRQEASRCLVSFGDQVVALLGNSLGSSSVPMEVRQQLPAVLLSIGTPAAEQSLVMNLLQSNCSLRFSIIRALNKLHQSRPEIAGDWQMIESVLAAEILGHYRSYQILHSIQSSGSTDAAIPQAIEETMRQERERIFRLLALRYPSLELHAAYLGLQATRASTSDNALEFLENVLNTQLRCILMPLLDPRVSVEEKARFANRLLRTEISTLEEAVAILIASEDSWLRACGAYAVGSLGIVALEDELTRCMSDSDPLTRESARSAKRQMQRSAGTG